MKSFLPLLLVTAGITIPQVSFSQENFIKGYVVHSNGDTASVLIDYRNWEKNPDRVFYKESMNSEKASFAPMEINAFGALDEIYVSAIVETEISPEKTNDLNYDKELKLIKKATFLQLMFQGDKSLYFYKNKMGKEQFYIWQDSAFVLLVYKKFLQERTDGDLINENKKYLGQLTYYLRECPDIISKLQNLRYSKKHMEKLFTYYYRCTNSKVEFQKKTEKTQVDFGILGGATKTGLKFTGPSPLALVNTSYEPSTSFTGGLFLDFVLPRNHGKWTIKNEIVYSNYIVHGHLEEHEGENISTTTNTRIGGSYINLHNMIHFKYPVKNIFIFVNLGISNGFMIEEANQLREVSKFYNDEHVDEYSPLKFRKYEQAILGGFGIKYKKAYCEMRYKLGNGMSEIIALKSATSRYSLLLGFTF